MRDLVRSYFRAISSFLEERLANLTKDLAWAWPAFLARSAGVAVALVLATHLIQASVIGSRNVTIGSTGVGCVLTVAVACIALQVWSLWRTRLDSTQLRPYVVALLLAAVTIGICTEAFAGLTVFGARHGWLRASAPEPSLWTAEHYYFWNLVNSIPLLSVPTTLGWPEPKVFDDPVGGALLLAFQIILIIPLVQIALSGYHFMEARRLATREKQYQRQRRTGKRFWRPGPQLNDAGGVWLSVIALTFASAGASAALIYFFNPASNIQQWLNGHLAAGLDISSVHVPLAWLETGPQWLSLVALILVCLTIVDFLEFAGPADVRSLPGAVGGLLAYSCVLGLLTLGSAMVTLLLLHVGLATAQPTIPPGSQVLAALNLHGWEIAAAVPGLDIPDTLRWSPSYRFIDHWSGAIVLTYKIGFFGVLVFPMGRILRAYVHRARPRRPAVAAISAAREFVALLREVQSKLDEAEQIVLESGKARNHALSRQVAQILATTSLRLPAHTPPVSTPRASRFRFDWQPHNAVQDAHRAFDQLEATLDRVSALFGDGDVSASADRAVTAALHHLELIGDLRWGFRREPPTADLAKTRALLDAAAEMYCRTAGEVLGKETSTHHFGVSPARPEMETSKYETI